MPAMSLSQREIASHSSAPDESHIQVFARYCKYTCYLGVSWKEKDLANVGDPSAPLREASG